MGGLLPPKGKLQCRPLIQMIPVGLMKQGRATFNLLQVAVTSLDIHNIELNLTYINKINEIF